jgi:RNA polymerase-binding transcription factor DksA
MTRAKTTDDGLQTWTRSQLLERRGYDQAIISEKSHQVEPVTPVAELAPTRTCAVCGADISANRLRRYRNTRTCGPLCATELDKRSKSARRKDRPRVVTKVASSTSENGLTVVRPRLAHFISELVAAGLVVTMEHDGISIYVGPR